MIAVIIIATICTKHVAGRKGERWSAPCDRGQVRHGHKTPVIYKRQNIVSFHRSPTTNAQHADAHTGKNERKRGEGDALTRLKNQRPTHVHIPTIAHGLNALV